MKIIVIFVLSMLPYIAKTQSLELSNLEFEKTSLEKRIKSLQDSLKLVVNRIEATHYNKLNKSNDGNIFIKVSKGGKIRSNQNNPTELPIYTFLDTATVKTYSYNNGYFKITYNGFVGYLNDLYVIDKDDVINHFENIKQLKLKIQAKKSENEMIKKYGKSVYDKLKNGYYWIGMTSDMALLSLGLPDKVNSSVGSWGNNEQWIYNNTYLYFENNKLTSYQK